MQPPCDSQRAKRHNAMPCVSVSQGFSQHRYQNPDSSPQPPGLHSSPRPLLPLLPFYFAMSPALSWDLHTCLSLIRENPCLNPCHSQHPLITQILAYLSPPQKGLHFASAISSLCKSLSIMCPCLISFTALVLVWTAYSPWYIYSHTYCQYSCISQPLLYNKLPRSSMA